MADYSALFAAVGQYYDPRSLVRFSESCANDYFDRLEAQAKALHGLIAKAQWAGRAIVLYGAGTRSIPLVQYLGFAPYLDLAVDDSSQPHQLPGIERIAKPWEIPRDAKLLVLLAVGAENEHRVKARMHNDAVYVSMLPPRDTMASIKSAMEAL